jgi:hypothetical protein
MNKFKHSGTSGDLIYSLSVMKYLGGGEFYLHLNQIEWIGAHFYGNSGGGTHQGRMNLKDFEFMKDFMNVQEYVTKFDVLNPTSTEISHNLDRFRAPFVGHPGNYIDLYSSVFGITDAETQAQIRLTPWLTVPTPTIVDGRTIVINRTERWLPPTLSPQWNLWKEQGLENNSVFVGLPHEYDIFRSTIGWDIPYAETKTMLELASIIAGSEAFIGNQSQCLAIAIGLGKRFICEARTDLPKERNECYFEDNPRGNYF